MTSDTRLMPIKKKKTGPTYPTDRERSGKERTLPEERGISKGRKVSLGGFRREGLACTTYRRNNHTRGFRLSWPGKGAGISEIPPPLSTHPPGGKGGGRQPEREKWELGALPDP